MYDKSLNPVISTLDLQVASTKHGTIRQGPQMGQRPGLGPRLVRDTGCRQSLRRRLQGSIKALL